MNKGIAIKAGIILGFFVLVLGLAFGCSSIKDKNIAPEISNREDVYLTVGNITVTNQELWEMMRLSDGLTYLEQYIEENIFLATEVAAVTQAEIDEKIEYYKYGTNDPEVIADIQEDAELEADLLEQYENSLIILGFDPDNSADLRKFVQLEIAKENATREYIENAPEGDALEITDIALNEYYNNNTKGDVCALDVRFNSTEEAEAVFNKFNLVPNYNMGWGLYTDTGTPIEDVATDDFDETNTDQLTDEQVFEYFIKMYNYMNPNATQIDEDATYTEFCTDHADTFDYNYDEMLENRQESEAYVAYATYIFDTLSFEDDETRFSYKLQTLGNFEVLAFKVSEEDVTDFDDLTQAEKDAVLDEMIEDSIDATTIQAVMDTYWDAVEYTIYDPIFKLKNQFNGGDEMDNTGHETLVAKVDTTEISADTLFDYMDESIGTYYTIELVKAKSLLASSFYTDVYGDSHDYLGSNNEAMVAHREELRNMKGTFSSDGYAPYGFSSATYTWEEFLVLAFGAESEEEVIRDLFVIGDLQPYMISETIDYANAATIIQEQIDEYFDLNVTHLLVYIDMDRDFTPDEFNDYVDGLTGQDETDYNAMKAAIEDLIEDRIDDEMTFEEIVDEFNDSLVDDVDNEWKEFKAAGFFLMTEDLSAQNSLTPATTANFDKDFVAAVKALYDEYVVDQENSATDIEELYDDALIQSNFGLHFILATEGEGFDQPTAEFTDTENDYTDGAEGTTVAPNATQAALYLEIKFAERVQETTSTILPTSVYDALEAYYSTTYNAYFSTGGYSIASVNYILDNNGVYAEDSAAKLAYLGDVLGVLYNSTFPEGFIIPE